MSKEYLEAFKIVYNNFDYLISDVGIENDDVNTCLKTIKEQLPTIKRALNRLECIDNANPSEALECLDKLTLLTCNIEWYKDNINIIKQALLKAQELENTFADSHICEIQKEFAKYDKLCEETKCEECALGVGDGICLRKTFERKWELQKEVVSPNSVNLLMRELDCKDFADLRKYARCGYDRLNSNKFKDSKEIKIEIPESSLMDYNPIKQYLKWEDLEFEHTPKIIDVKMNGNKYTLVVGYNVAGNHLVILRNDKQQYFFLEFDKQFFNDLRLERVEE